MRKRTPGMKKTSAVPLRTLLPQLCEDLALDKKVQEMAVLALWAQAVPPEYRAKTRARRLQSRGHDTVMSIRVADAATAGDLNFCLPEILAHLNRFAPQTGIAVDRIHLQIGSLE